jgi:hypothetical protein
MRLIKQRPANQTKAYLNLDEAEMALSLLDETVPDDRRLAFTPARMSNEALCEFRSAASLILEKHEIEALEQEFRLGPPRHRVAA